MLFPKLDLIIERERHSAALNMAIDEALLRALRGPLLRIYQWSRPSVSFGYFERFEPVRALFPDHDLVRRWTGGGMVEHAGDFTYSLMVPSGNLGRELRTPDSYQTI